MDEQDEEHVEVLEPHRAAGSRTYTRRDGKLKTKNAGAAGSIR
jgi:hypothetical protein